jgi:purine-binding chemotaxis protein CheW
MSATVTDILEARAQRLARRIDRHTPQSEVELVAFAIGGERYAIASPFVRRVVAYAAATPLPGLPPHLLGIVNAGGHLVPVIDLPALLGGIGVPPRPGLRSLMLGSGRVDFAVLTEPDTSILRLSEDALGAEQPGHDPVIRCVCADALIVLDGAALLSDPRLFIDPHQTDRRPTEGPTS